MAKRRKQQSCTWGLKHKQCIVTLWQKYEVLECTEQTDGQQKSGLCCRSGLRSFYGHFDTFLDTLPSYLTTRMHCNTMNPHWRRHHDWPLFSWAMRSACKDVCGLISSWHTSTFAWLMAGRAFCSSSLPSSMLAPATITMAFSPASGHQKRCVNVQQSLYDDSENPWVLSSP